jgi:hypothetical protein
MVLGFILSAIMTFVSGILAQFWGWIVGGAVALLGFMFSPTIRKYSLALIAVIVICLAIYLWGYNSNHNVQTVTHTCDEFRKWLVSSNATDKATAIFKRHGLCQ